MQTSLTTPASFVGNVPENYETYMVPMYMRPYAEEMGRRVARSHPKDILEIAAGTGILTECLRRENPEANIVATDLNEDMMDHGKRVRPNVNVTWKQADANALPFEDASFDAVVMQFGYMFFEDPKVAVKEAFRVLRPGGRYVFDTWDSRDQNEIAQETYRALTDQIEPGPPGFLHIPFGCHEEAPILENLRAAGFKEAKVERIPATSTAPSAKDAATALVFGSPLFGLIQESGRNPENLRDLLANALAARFGDNPLNARMQALIFEAIKP